MKSETAGMKKFNGARFWFVGLILCLGVVTSCTDNIESDLKLTGNSYVMFVNAVPGNTGLDLFVGDTLVNVDTLGNRISVPYGSGIGYYQLNKVGSKKVDVRAASGQGLLSQNMYLKPEQFMSIFAVRKQTSDSLIYVALLDKVNEIRNGKAYVRFVNLVPDTMAFNLRTTISSDTTAKLSFSNATYRSASTFSVFDAGDYKIELSNARTNAVLRSRNVKLEGRKLYTIWVGGLANGTGTDAINTYIINNN